MPGMAYVKDSVRHDGSVYYTVMWRAGGTAGRKQEPEAFDEEPAAQRFKDLVHGHGRNWPPRAESRAGFVAERRRKSDGDEATGAPAALNCPFITESCAVTASCAGSRSLSRACAQGASPRTPQPRSATPHGGTPS